MDRQRQRRGSLQVKYKPCDIVLPNQFVDRTKRSFEHTFFGRGIVAHIAFADPICEELRQLLLARRANGRERSRWRQLREHGRSGFQHARESFPIIVSATT
jgi:purine nucleoside phosphorylase